MTQASSKRQIHSLTDAELALYCTTVHNLPVEITGDRSKMLAGLSAIGVNAIAWVDVPTAVTIGPPVANAAPPPPSVGKPDDMVQIIITASEEKGGDEPVPVSVNGSAIWIPRGYPVNVKRKYVEALRHAKRTVHDPDPSPLGGTLPPREVLNYPFSVIADPAPVSAAA